MVTEATSVPTERRAPRRFVSVAALCMFGLLGMVGVVSTTAGCEIEAEQKEEALRKAERAAEQAKVKLDQAGQRAREEYERARPEVERKLGKLSEDAQKGYERTKANLEEATAYTPIEGAAEAISCSDDVCTVQGEFAKGLMGRTDWLAREAKIAPAFRGGKINGLRLVYVHGGSLADLLGFQAGDVITTVDGKSITSIGELQSLADQDRSKSRDIVVEYERGGETKKLTLRQRGA